MAPGRGPKQSHLLIFTASVSVFLIDARMDQKTLKWIRRHMRVCRHIRWQGYARAAFLAQYYEGGLHEESMVEAAEVASEAGTATTHGSEEGPEGIELGIKTRNTVYFA